MKASTPQGGAGQTPEDKTAELLESAWKQYFCLFETAPHGTLPQLRAMLCLKGGKEIVRAVNNFDALLQALKEEHDNFIDESMGEYSFRHKERPCAVCDLIRHSEPGT